MIEQVTLQQPISLPVLPAPTPATKFTCPLDQEQAKQQARIFKALSDATRLRILSLLSKHGGEMCVFEIVECFSLAQPTLSHHLRILHAAGLVDFQKRSLYAYYFIQQQKMNEVKQTIKMFEATGQIG